MFFSACITYTEIISLCLFFMFNIHLMFWVSWSSTLVGLRDMAEETFLDLSPRRVLIPNCDCILRCLMHLASAQIL